MQALRIAALLFFATLCNAAAAQPLYGIAMHGDPAPPADFKHFPYVNPDVKRAAASAMASSALSTISIPSF